MLQVALRADLDYLRWSVVGPAPSRGSWQRADLQGLIDADFWIDSVELPQECRCMTAQFGREITAKQVAITVKVDEGGRLGRRQCSGEHGFDTVPEVPRIAAACVHLVHVEPPFHGAENLSVPNGVNTQVSLDLFQQLRCQRRHG